MTTCAVTACAARAPAAASRQQTERTERPRTAAGAPGAGTDSSAPGEMEGSDVRRSSRAVSSSTASSSSTGSSTSGTPDRRDPAKAPPPPGLAGEADRYSKRLTFQGGAPELSIRLMEGQETVRFRPLGRMRVKLAGPIERTLEAPAGGWWRVRILDSRPAQLRYRLVLAEHPLGDDEGLAESEARWTERGLSFVRETLGSLYGISGKVLDNRRRLLVSAPSLPFDEASALGAQIADSHGDHLRLHPEQQAPPRALLELFDPEGLSMGLAESVLEIETLRDAGFEVARVEHGVGYDWHGFEDRGYRGTLRLTADSRGKLAVVNLLSLEELLYGLVPAELYASAHPEALKAQSVTARGEVLAKIGLKHLADPYHLCSEQHCAVYRGRSSEAKTTNRAVDATRGLALFSQTGRLVDAVYSAICGGHTEDNDVVWGTRPDPSLRGRPDLIGPAPRGATPENLARFLRTELPAACRLSSLGAKKRYRWERTFTAPELDALVTDLGVGGVEALRVLTRGVSGRVETLEVVGDSGRARLHGELNIRRRFQNLNSAMFLVHREPSNGPLIGWRFEGGGWGHGVGMCQTGAIGRAEHGQTFEEILGHYYNGAQVAPLYR